MSADPLDHTLARLEDLQIIRRLGDPDLAFLIRHTLVQETVYASLLRQERKRLNHLVGESLEEIYSTQLTENAARLAAHFDAAGDYAKAYTYSMQAGENDLRTNALAEATHHFDRAFAAAERASLPILDVCLKRGRVAELRGDYARARQLYLDLRAWGEQRADPRIVLAALMAEATIYSIPSTTYDAARAQELSDRALALARQLQDPAAEAKILWNLMLLNSRVGPSSADALAYGERALAIAEAHHLVEQRAYLLNDMGPLYAFQGEAERSRQYNLEARALWREWGNLPMLADNFGYAVMNHFLAGSFDEAIRASDEGYQIAAESGNHWGEGFNLAWVGNAIQQRGEIARAYAVRQQAIALKPYFPPVGVITQSHQAAMLGDLGDLAEALTLAESAVTFAEAHFPVLRGIAVATRMHLLILGGDTARAQELLKDLEVNPRTGNANPFFFFDAWAVSVELLLAQGDAAGAAARAAELADYVESHHFVNFGWTTRRLQALALARQGDFQTAVELLARARALAQEKGARWSLWQLLCASLEVAERSGDAASAHEHRAAAREAAAYLAARTPNTPGADGAPGLRDLFMRSADVRRLEPL